MVAPSNDCKPGIRLDDTHLIAFRNVNVCGTPPVSTYWLGYSNLSVINVQPGKEAGPYHACIYGPSLKCTSEFKATDLCSSFKRDTVDDKLLPKIALSTQNVPDGSLMLLCQFNDRSASHVSWRRNGIIINNSPKYYQVNDFLIIRQLSNDDKYDIYTCFGSGGRYESDPYGIEANGPSFVEFTPSPVIVKENDKVDVLCSTDCYPLCYVQWRKLDLSLGNINLFVKDYTLTLTSVTRHMSGNYSCKVQNRVTGKFIEASLPVSVYYGPDKCLLNTSNSIIEVDEFDSITIICTAECFPPCLINWTETYMTSLIGDAVLKLVNVSANASYKCIARNTAFDTNTESQTINIYAKLDETLIPQIRVYSHNVSDSSVVLKCHSFRKHKGRFTWMVNGSQVKHTDRYSPVNDFLSVRYLTAADQNNSYTCKEPGTKFQSDPFWIKASGPTSITLGPKDLVLKEHIGLNISCLANCYPFCSFHWFKMDPYSGQKLLVSEENALQITNISREMSGNYSCKVQNIITGVFNESTLSMAVIYGPDEIVINNSKKEAEVYKFGSTTLSCSADCFPPCLFRWTFSNIDTVIEGGKLTILNVTSNVSLTCHASNQISMNDTISETINITLKSDDFRQKESSADKDSEPTMIDIRYLVYAVLTIGGTGVIVAVVCCLRKKYRHCLHATKVSNNTRIAQSGINERHQEGTLSEHYWTIVSNTRGKFYTAIEIDNNVEPREFVDPAQSMRMEFDLNTITRHHHSDELEIYTHSIHSDSIDLKTSSLDSAEHEGYIHPIPYDPANGSEYVDPKRSNSVVCNKYLELNPSDPFAIEIYSDPSSFNSDKDDKSTDGSIPSYPG
ncbi:hypothetical protein ACJMK2_025641, partial [Sinanodonta woodiana]